MTAVDDHWISFWEEQHDGDDGNEAAISEEKFLISISSFSFLFFQVDRERISHHVRIEKKTHWRMSFRQKQHLEKIYLIQSHLSFRRSPLVSHLQPDRIGWMKSILNKSFISFRCRLRLPLVPLLLHSFSMASLGVQGCLRQSNSLIFTNTKRQGAREREGWREREKMREKHAPSPLLFHSAVRCCVCVHVILFKWC